MADYFIEPNLDNLPPELRAINRWVTWRAEGNPGEKPRKVPYAPDRINTRASSTDPATWGSFQQAEASYLEGDRTGVGIVLDGTGLVGVDIDHCVTDGTPNPKALALLDGLSAAYVEISPSGTGLRAFGYADNLTTGCKGKLNGLDMELYSTGRYLTLTGCTIKTGPIGALTGFKELSERIRSDRKVNPGTGEITTTAPDERHANLVQRVLSGDVYHDSLRDLAASLVATGMNAGAVVNHLRGLMDASQAPHDDRWAARRGQIPALVSSGGEKFSPVVCLTPFIDTETGEIVQPPPMLKHVSVGDVLTNPAPPPAFVWDGYLPRGVVALLGAHGGTGKSTIALMLSVCAALGRPLFGVDTVQCKTLFVSLEDGAHIVRHRLADICRRWEVDPMELDGKMHIVDGTEYPELFTADNRGAGETTATHLELRKLVQSEGVGLVVVDNASDAYGGDEINRRQVRAFMRALVEVARLTNCAVMLLAHVDKNTSRSRKAEGGEGYSGSTAWHNSARSRLFMTRAENGLLTLEHQKSNLSKLQEQLSLVWPVDGLPMLEGEALEMGEFTDSVQARANDAAAAALLRIVAEYEGREQYCSPSPTARNNVHSLLKVDPAFKALKLSADDTKRVVTHCHRSKWLEALEYRSKHSHKYCQRWSITLQGRAFAGLLAPTSPTSAHMDDGEQGAQRGYEGVPTSPTSLGGTGEERAAYEGVEHGSLLGETAKKRAASSVASVARDLRDVFDNLKLQEGIKQ